MRPSSLMLGYLAAGASAAAIGNKSMVAAASSDFTGSCSDCYMRNLVGPDPTGSWLACTCKMRNGQNNSEISLLDLNYPGRLGNGDGNLVWNSASYLSSCVDSQLNGRMGVYFSFCKNRDGVDGLTWIDLNRYIGNDNGYLVA